jgi:hypothetical protein
MLLLGRKDEGKERLRAGKVYKGHRSPSWACVAHVLTQEYHDAVPKRDSRLRICHGLPNRQMVQGLQANVYNQS